jgi:hypothetical protein
VVIETSKVDFHNPEALVLLVLVAIAAMPSSRLKYTKFKANDTQDVDDWHDQFSAIWQLMIKEMWITKRGSFIVCSKEKL